MPWSHSPPQRILDAIPPARPAAGTVATGVDGLTRETRAWLGPLGEQLPSRFRVIAGPAAEACAHRTGAAAFTIGSDVVLGTITPYQRERVLRHELVHLAQIELARRSGRVDGFVAVEHEADALSALPVARRAACGADPDAIHPIIWFVAIGVGLYILLRPGVANAPGPKDKVLRGPSLGQIVAEAVCLFVVPGGAMALGGRLGLGFLGSSALAGALTTTSMRATSDVARGGASPPLMYLFDATTGAAFGFVVAGGIRLIGGAGTYAFDRLASYGASKSDIALTRVLAERAAVAPLTAAEAQQVLGQRGLIGQASHWWLNRRNLIMLYRGQEIATPEILSPLARTEGLAASEQLVQRLRQVGLTDSEIAAYTAKWHTEAVPGFAAPPGFAGEPLGAVGIPATNVPGIAANFGGEGVIYVVRMPKAFAIPAQGWQGLALEGEHVILNRIPPGSIVEVIPASRVAPLLVDESGLLIPGAR